MDDNHEQRKHTANHDQPPGNLVGPLILFADGAELRMRENPERDEA